jgi:hypothetical protein
MASPSSRQELIDFCLRRLGEPVLEINVDVDQIEDKVDDAIQKYQEFHSDATIRTYLKYQVTADDVTNGYVPISSNIIFVSKVFPFSSTFGSSGNLFDIRYQMFLNNMGDFINFAGDLAYLYQMEQYLSMIDLQLHGHPTVKFSRRQNRLYIWGDFEDKDLQAGDYLVAEVFQTIDPDTHTSIYNDMFIKDYTTALIKQQWGANLSKFEGMQLPGGVTLNGRQIFEDATADIERLEEKLRTEQELPVDFFVG